MPITFESRTINVTIERDPQYVYEFVSAPANLPKWASGLSTSIEEVNGEWLAETPQGPAKFRFVEHNNFGVLDHFVNAARGPEVYIPMRVVPNASGSELIFTVFRLPDVSEEQFERDIEWVQRDLNALKTFLERDASA
jgi:hypothetical protein